MTDTTGATNEPQAGAQSLGTRQPAPAPDPLRDQYAAAIYERNNPPRRWADAHPDDLLAYAADADAVLAVRDTELQQLRAQVDDLIRRNSEYADRAIANGERADKAERAVRNIARLAALDPGQGQP